MNRDDGTEPDSLPHFAHCSGPCNQGRQPCPCPLACEREATENFDSLELLGTAVIWVLAVVGAGVLVGYFV